MKRGRARTIFVALCIAAGVGAIVGPASAAQPFSFSMDEALARIRGSIDRQKAIAPIPRLICEAPPSVLRECRARITPQVELSITQTAKAKDDTTINAFLDGAPGVVFSMAVEVRTGSGDQASIHSEIFSSLCIAIVSASRPGWSLQRVDDTVDRLIRRAINKSGTDAQGHAQEGDNQSIITVDVNPFGTFQCAVETEW